MATLLKIVQNILHNIDGDQINSISDTEEAEQIANFVQAAYKDLVSHTEWPHTRRAISLESFADNNFPTHLSLPDNVKKLISVKYDSRTVSETRRFYKDLKYLDPDEFLVKLNKRDSTDINVRTIIDGSGIELLIRKDKAPEYFTSINDTDLIFDSYDNSVGATLVENRFQVQAYIIPAFSIADDFIPDLPPDAFSLLENEALSRSQFRLRQMQDAKAEQEVKRQSNWLSRNSWKTNGGIKYPNYGRKK